MELELNIRGLLSGLFRQQVKILLAGAAVVALGLIYLLGMPKMYESHGSVLVKFGQEARLNTAVTGNGGNESGASDRSDLLQSNISIIYSNDLLREVVQQVGPEKINPSYTGGQGQETPVNAAVLSLQRGGLVANAGARTNVIDISVFHKDPEVAKLIAATLIEKFIQRQADIFNKPQTGFLQQQIAEAGQKLAEAQKVFQAFKREAGISDLTTEVDQLIRQKTDLSGIAFQAVTKAQENLAELEAKETEMQATYSGASPVLARMRQSIAAARAQVQARQNDLNAMQSPSEGSVLGSKLQAIDERLSYIESKRPEYAELDNNVQVAQENYKFYQQRGEEARANDILNQQNITRISVIDYPEAPILPKSRHRMLLLIAFILAGGLAGLATAVLFELLDDRFRSPEQLARRLGVPVLATFNRGSV